jgi:RNA polymerase sigma factor (sigma-70 family)
MHPPADHLVFGESASSPVSPRDPTAEYRRLLVALSARAKRMGSQDPEAAAQETLKRSWANAGSRPAVAYYFSDSPPHGADAPEWPLDRLLAWLHVALQYVVREESGRASHWREVQAGRSVAPDPADPAQDQLHALIQRENEGIVAECFRKLGREQRTVLRMRVDGLKYEEIASRLGVNENTVATWVSRGIRELGQFVSRREARR